jgi:hypothetical protein
MGEFADAVFKTALHLRFGFRSSAQYPRRCRLSTRRATRRDARRFPTEPRIGESENPRSASDLRFALSGKALFFGHFLFGQKKKVTRPRSGRKLCALLTSPASWTSLVSANDARMRYERPITRFFDMADPLTLDRRPH